MNVNIWGDAKKDRVANKNYVGYIPSDYENYGFKISASRHLCNGNSQSAEEPFELDPAGHSRYEFNITCPDSVKMWKFSYKLTSTTSIKTYLRRLKYILKGSNDYSNWNTIHDSIAIERIHTKEELNSERYFIKSIFPNILIENPKAYKYYMFIVTFDNPNIGGCLGHEIDIDNILKAAVISNPQLYIMNDNVFII